jgi:hypothetical protein
VKEEKRGGIEEERGKLSFLFPGWRGIRLIVYIVYECLRSAPRQPESSRILTKKSRQKENEKETGGDA